MAVKNFQIKRGVSMKFIKAVFLAVFVFVPLTVFAQRANVAVNNGSGDGSYKGQNFAHVWADPNPAGMVFDRWTGDTFLLQSPFEAHTKLRTAKLNVNLTATYKPAPVWTPATETISETIVVHYFPANPQGVIFRFHGSGGSAPNLFNNIENRIFNNDAVADGYAVVAVNSFDRVNRQWDNTNIPPNNRDIQNVQAIIQTFISRGLITANTPLFAVGISNGGSFAPRASLFLNFRGTAIYIAPGQTGLLAQTTVPTIWCLAANDETIGANALQQARFNYANLVSRNIPAQFNLNTPSPVYPERFWRIPNLTANDSRAIYNALKNNAFLDNFDFLTADPQTSGWQAVIPPQYNSFLPEILDQLEICYTEHQFFSDYNRRVLNFFNARR